MGGSEIINDVITTIAFFIFFLLYRSFTCGSNMYDQLFQLLFDRLVNWKVG